MKTRQVDRIINALSNDIKIKNFVKFSRNTINWRKLVKISESYYMYEIMFLCVVEIEKYVMH